MKRGGTVDVALEFVLRSDSPVTCEYHEFGSAEVQLGSVYPCE